jgi:CcmD family protein
MPDNDTFIIAAFVVTWVVIIGYVLHLRRTRRTARRRYDDALRDVSGGGRTS